MYRGNPSGIAAMTEKAIVAMGLQSDRNGVLAVTANILAYRKATNHGKGKHKRRFQTEEMSAAVRDCLKQYSNVQYIRAVRKSIGPELGSAVRRRESVSTETGDRRLSGSR